MSSSTEPSDQPAADPGAEKAFEEGGAAGLVDYAKEKLENWRNTKVNIAVVGQSGAGKSSFINAIRKMDDDNDENYAKTGCTETTRDKQEYSFPKNKNIKLWDLPGAGTKDFEAATYAKEMKFTNYDAFVILSSERFTSIDKMISEEARKIERPFFFARTKMDNTMRDEKRTRKKKFNAEEVKEEIRTDCRTKIDCSSSEEIFLIANISDDELNDYFPGLQFDNNRLQEKIIEELPDLQKKALVFSLTCNTPNMVDMKIKMLKQRINLLTLGAAAGGAAAGSLPGVSLVAVPTVGAGTGVIIVNEVKFQKEQLGIDDISITAKAKQVELSKDDFLKRVGTAVDIDNASVFKKTLFDLLYLEPAFMAVDLAAFIAAELVMPGQIVNIGSIIGLVTGLGAVVGGLACGGSVYIILNQLLDSHTETAKGCIRVIEDIAETMMK